MWCSGCDELGDCGGLRVKRALSNCLDYCCGKPTACTSMCPRNPVLFADMRAEIGGDFDLSKTPRGPLLRTPNLPPAIPMIFHRGGREEIASLNDLEIVCLPLFQLYRKRPGSSCDRSPEELRQRFGLNSEAIVVASGVGQDADVESWWALGRESRLRAIAGLLEQRVAFATTPNFSVAADEPRWNDLHAMKRAAIVHSEFLHAGLPTAFHINGRTDTDYRRLSEFVRDRDEITHVAVEMLTGAGAIERADWHCDHLARLRDSVSRALHVTFRGRLEHLSRIVAIFGLESVAVVDSDAFMRTVKRRRLVPDGNTRLRAEPANDTDLAPLFESNWRQRETFIRAKRHAA